jgi:hypothetical protein
MVQYQNINDRENVCERAQHTANHRNSIVEVTMRGFRIVFCEDKKIINNQVINSMTLAAESPLGGKGRRSLGQVGRLDFFA